MTTEAFEKGRQAAREAIAMAEQSGAQIQGQAIPWFREEDWPRWQALDPSLEPDYDYWLGRAEGAFAEFEASGVPAIKVLFDPDEYLVWRAANPDGRESGARANYAALKARAGDLH